MTFAFLHRKVARQGLGSFDLDQDAILKRLRDCSESDAGAHFSEFNALLQHFMPHGRIFHNFIEPILQHASTNLSSVAYLNLLKWRTKKSSGLNKLYDLSWHDHTREQFHLLKPRLVIAIGTDAGKAFQRHQPRSNTLSRDSRRDWQQHRPTGQEKEN